MSEVKITESDDILVSASLRHAISSCQRRGRVRRGEGGACLKPHWYNIADEPVESLDERVCVIKSEHSDSRVKGVRRITHWLAISAFLWRTRLLLWITLLMCLLFPLLFIIYLFITYFLGSLFAASNFPFFFLLHFVLSFHFLESLFSVSNSPFLFLTSLPSFVLLSWISFICFKFPFLFLLHFLLSFYFLGLPSLFPIPLSLSSFISSFRFTSLSLSSLLPILLFSFFFISSFRFTFLGLSSLLPILNFSFFLQFLLSFLPSKRYICRPQPQ